MQMREARNDGVLHGAAHPFQHDFQIIVPYAVQNQQKLVAAETDEYVVVADAGADGIRGGFQREIARMVAVGVVAELEIIQIHDGDAGGAGRLARHVFVIVPIVRADQRVAVEFGVVAGDFAHDAFAAVRVQRVLARRALNQFQHIGSAFDLVRQDGDVQHIGSADLDSTGLFPGGKGLFGRAVTGKMPFMSADIAFSFGRGSVSAFVYIVYVVRAQQTDVRIDR